MARCTCPASYSDPAGDGSVCADIDECAAGTHSCDAHATCTNSTGAFSCACAAGYTGTGLSCAPCTSCAAGTHETGACSATVDRVCSACTSCAATEYESGACTATSDRVCSACSSIAHCAAAPTCTSAGDQQCASCDASYYVVDGAADSCAACSVGCPSGQYQSAACAATSNRVCSGCTAIAHCATTPTCSSASDQQCAACAASYYLVDGVSDSCAACSGMCPSGKYQSAACGATSDRVCSTCSVCSGATFQAAACTPTSDTVCTACPAHCTSCTDSSTCSACEAGYFGATCQNLRADCYDILTHGGSPGNGIYSVDPDGAGGVSGMQVYCDMTNGGWTELNDQDVALGYLPAATWLAGVNTTAPNGGQWGILNRLSLFASSGGVFELRLTFGQTESASVQWKQSADPLSGAGGTLSNVVMSPTNQVGCSAFLGLAQRGAFAALDGDTLGCWWFAVGAAQSYSPTSGIPAFADSTTGQLVTDRARLWVRKNGP